MQERSPTWLGGMYKPQNGEMLTSYEKASSVWLMQRLAGGVRGAATNRDRTEGSQVTAAVWKEWTFQSVWVGYCMLCCQNSFLFNVFVWIWLHLFRKQLLFQLRSFHLSSRHNGHILAPQQWNKIFENSKSGIYTFCLPEHSWAVPW